MAGYLQSAVRSRFIRNVLQDEGEKMLQRQGEQIAARTTRRSGRLESTRQIQVRGSDGSLDGTLTFTHTAYERFLDMKRIAGRPTGSRKIHNRFVMLTFGKIAWRLMHEFTDEMQRSLKQEFSETAARFLQ